MIHETHYTLAEAVELVGRYLHGDVWIGGEAGVVFCWLKENDIVMLQAGVQKAVKPSRSPGRSGSDGAPKQIMRILDHALEEGIAEEIARVEQLFVDDGSVNFKHLWGPAKDETLWRLRAGDPLTEADFIILDELEKEYHAKERRESVVLWFTNHAWSGDDSEVPLTGYIYTLDDGKITPILAHCWGARSFKLSLYNNKATMDDQPWPADGTLVFLKSQLDAVLRGKQVALPSPAGRPDAATGGTDEGKGTELSGPAIHAAATPTKAATKKLFADLHRDFLNGKSRPATVTESYKMARSIGVGRDRARELRRELPPHLKNQRRRPSQK